MLKWVAQFKKANLQTKYFVLNGLLYGVVIVATTIYCYGRLDYVRSYKTHTNPQSK